MRAHNFSAGPASLPEEVLLQAQQELLDYKSGGTSVMEISHRSAEYMELAQNAEQSLRRLLKIPENYAVLFLQGGASLQFSALPLNLAYKRQANYLITGIWSEKAYKEGARIGDAKLVASSKESNFTKLVKQEEIPQDLQGAYLHYTSNETIGGLQFDYVPQSNLDLVCDMSSDILSKPIDVSKYGVIYAGAQKNIGPAGLVIAIVRKDLLELEVNPCTPSITNYKLQADNGSMYNTPATYSWYLAGLVFDWLENKVGGLEKIYEINLAKSNLLYDFIDSSDFYANNVEKNARSIMNVPFILRDENLNAQFLAESKAANLLNLKGHRSVGGMRASIYNAVSKGSVEKLVEFMQNFAKKQG